MRTEHDGLQWTTQMISVPLLTNFENVCCADNQCKSALILSFNKTAAATLGPLVIEHNSTNKSLMRTTATVAEFGDQLFAPKKKRCVCFSGCGQSEQTSSWDFHHLCSCAWRVCVSALSVTAKNKNNGRLQETGVCICSPLIISGAAPSLVSWWFHRGRQRRLFLVCSTF